MGHAGAPEHQTEGSGRQEAYPKLPIEHFVNMLLGRVSFDVLRSPEVMAALKAHMHRKLNELRFPSYMHGIEVSHAPPWLALNPKPQHCLVMTGQFLKGKGWENWRWCRVQGS